LSIDRPPQQTDFSESELLPQSEDTALSPPPPTGSRLENDDAVVSRFPGKPRGRFSSPNSFSCRLLISYLTTGGGSGGNGGGSGFTTTPRSSVRKGLGIRVSVRGGGAGGGCA